MLILAGLRRQRAGRGFTLIELLLTTVLLLLLLGAVAFSFNQWQAGAQLEEAGQQMEGLLHYLRAQAAQTGRRVQLNFEEKIEDDFFLALGGLRVLWEPDPLEQPGTLQEFLPAQDWVKGIAETVMVESVQPLDANGHELAPAPLGEGSEAFWWDDAFMTESIPINFYPDGSSDSARIVITSWDFDDPRQMEVKLRGLTGSIRRRMLSGEGESLDLPEAEETSATNTTVRVPANDEASGP